MCVYVGSFMQTIPYMKTQQREFRTELLHTCSIFICRHVTIEILGLVSFPRTQKNAFILLEAISRLYGEGKT